LITKKAIVQAATEVAERSPSSRNHSSKMVTYRHPRGLIGNTLHNVGLSPREIKTLHGNRKYDRFLNPAATAWVREANKRANKGMAWGEVVSSTR
jgi:hypothetical protein